jgi:hypothetical protein
MVAMNPDGKVPASADERLDELAQILARGVHRLAAKKSRFCGADRLEFPRKTRLSVTTSDDRTECEVT